MTAPEEQFAQAVLNGWPLDQVPIKMNRKVRSSLAKMKTNAIESRDYRRVQLIETAIRDLEDKGTEMKYHNAEYSNIMKLKEKLETAKREMQEALERGKGMTMRFNEESEKSLQEQEDEHAQELSQFEKEYDMEPPAKFRKFSREYWRLKNQAEMMVSSKRYVEANDLRREVDKMEQIEKKRQMDNWMAYVAQQREKLLQRQEVSKKYLLEKWQKDWDGLVRALESDEERRRNNIAALEAEIRRQTIEPEPQAQGLPRLNTRQSNGPSGRMQLMRAKEYAMRRRSILSNRARRRVR